MSVLWLGHGVDVCGLWEAPKTTSALGTGCLPPLGAFCLPFWEPSTTQRVCAAHV